MRLRAIQVLSLDIDGTLTDGKLYWAGDDFGWTQRYAVRDGEALLRLGRRGVQVVPISRNKTRCARARMQGLKLPLDWVGVDDKQLALDQLLQRYQVPASAVAYVGDGPEDAPVFARVGLGLAVQDAHPLARAQAHHLLQAVGGEAAVEEVVDLLHGAHGWPLA